MEEQHRCRSEGQVKPVQVLKCLLTNSLYFGLVAFTGTNYHKLHWRMRKLNSTLKSSSFLCFLTSFYFLSFGLHLRDIFVHFCLLFLHHQCNKEQTLFGCLKIQHEKAYFWGFFPSLTLKYVKTEWSLRRRNWALWGKRVGPEGQDGQLQILCLWVLLFEHVSVKLWPFTMLFIHGSLIFTKRIKPCCFINALRDLT